MSSGSAKLKGKEPAVEDDARASEAETVASVEPKRSDEDEKKSQIASKHRPLLEGMKVLLVITVLWTSEIVSFAIPVIRDKFIDQNFRYYDIATVETGTRNFLGTLTLISMMSLGTVLTMVIKIPVLKIIERLKFWIMFGGLACNLGSAVFGILLVTTNSKTVAIAMTWLEIGWNTVQPLRFWYIFHQKFPISMRWSHFLVSWNLLVTGIFTCFILVLVKEATHSIPQAFFLYAFVSFAVAAVAWLIGTILIKRLLNPAKGDLETVRKVYAQTEASESFERRQSFISIVLFLALMCPSLIFPIMYEVISFGHAELTEKCLESTIGGNRYRPDLLCSLAVLIVIEVLYQFLKIVRNVLTDLILIAVSHILVIASLIGCMYILYLTKDFRARSPEPGDATISITTTDEDFYFVQLGNLSPRQFRGGYYGVVRDLGDGIVPVKVANTVTGEVIFEDIVNLEPSQHLSLNAFNFMEINGKFQIFKIPAPPLTHQFNIRYFISNGLEECNEFNETVFRKYYNPRTTRGLMVHGRCLPCTLVIMTPKLIFHKPPAYNESIIMEHPCLPKDDPITQNGKVCNKKWNLRFANLGLYCKLVHPELDCNRKFGLATKPSSVINIRLSQFRTYFAPTLSLGNVVQLRTIGDEILIVSMCLYGTGLGIGWVAYFHFFWIQSPVRWRTLFIFGFFAMIFAASSFTKDNFTKFDENPVFTVLVVATLCFLGHLAATVLFVLKWSLT